MPRKITGLKFKNPEFYFKNEDPLWLSRVEFTSNIGIPLAVLGQNDRSDQVYGIVKLRSAIPVNDLDSIMGRVPADIFKQFRDVDGQIWAYPVDPIREFHRPKKVQDGLMDDQRLWVKEVEFKQVTPDDIQEMDQSELQRKHDRIHAAHRNGNHSVRLFNLHKYLADEYNRRENLNHTTTDPLDWRLDLFELKSAEEFSPACRQSNESQDECVSRKVPEIKEEKPGWSQKRVVAAAISMCEEPCSENSNHEPNPILANLGAWTAKNMANFREGLNKKQAKEAARIANEKFFDFLETHSLRYAIQLSISSGVAAVT